MSGQRWLYDLLGSLLGLEQMQRISGVKFGWGAPWAQRGSMWLLFGCLALLAAAAVFYLRYQTDRSRRVRWTLLVFRGLLLCLAIIGIFAFIVLRGYTRLLQENDLFVVLAGAGLLTQFGLQAAINIGVNLHLLPTKGMTLPFISYGGSSLIALALGMGMLLALTRRRPQNGGRG